MKSAAAPSITKLAPRHQRCPVSVMIHPGVQTRCDSLDCHGEHYAIGRRPGIACRWSDRKGEVWFVGIK